MSDRKSNFVFENTPPDCKEIAIFITITILSEKLNSRYDKMYMIFNLKVKIKTYKLPKSAKNTVIYTHYKLITVLCCNQVYNYLTASIKEKFQK